MTRELKFRVWDTNTKTFYYHSIRDYEEIHHINLLCTDSVGSNLIEMQYTGLKDKNGKEIYEGDILSFKNLHLHRIVRVVWCDDMAGWAQKITISFTSSKHGNKPTKKFKRRLYKSDAKELEVIGNIHANPDLIQKSALR